MKASAFIGVSLDGFIARENGDIDWLGNGVEDGEDFGYKEFFKSVDALVMGRKTFEKVLSFEEWLYGEKPVFVLSSRPIKIPSKIQSTTQAMNLPPKEVMEELSKRGMNHIYVDGGQTIQRFLNEGLIQNITITRLPILIGKGIPLFGPLSKDIKLRHINTKTFFNKLVQSEYEIIE